MRAPAISYTCLTNSVIQCDASGFLLGKLLFGTIVNWCVFMWRGLGFGWDRMAILAEDGIGVFIHGTPVR